MSFVSMSFVSIRALRPAARIAVAALAVAVAAPLAANANANATITEKVVHYSDLNLSTQAGVVSLYTRLRGAADLVCGDYESRNLRLRHLRDACYAEALTSAVATVDHSAVTALHLADRRVRLARRVAEARS